MPKQPRLHDVEAPDETPRKKLTIRQGRLLQKSTQVPSLSHGNVHRAASTRTATVGKPSPINRNPPKHEKSPGSYVVLPSSSSPALPSLSLSSPTLELSSVTIYPYIEEGPIGYNHPKIDEPS